MVGVEDRVLGIIESREEELASMLQRLVRFESVNPPGNEGPIARYCGERLKASGFEVELVEIAKDRPNVIGRLKGTVGKPCLLCYSHLDVVPAGDLSKWKYPPFEGRRVGDELHGRGSQDHKYPIPPLIIAVDAIREAGVKLKGDLMFTFVADEEAGGTYGFRTLVEKGYFNNTDCLIYCSGVSGTTITGSDVPGVGGSVISIGCNGVMNTTVTVRGYGVHTMYLEKGVNAILVAMRIISRLEELADKVNKRTHPLTGKSRMSINMIEGGTKINQVPDKCVITIDRRITPAENFEDARNEIQDVLNEMTKEDPKLDLELITDERNPPTASYPDAPIIQILKRAGEELIGVPVRVLGLSSSSDYAWYAKALGKPIAHYGISNTPDIPHAPNEYVKIADLVSTSKLYALAMMRYLRTEP